MISKLKSFLKTKLFNFIFLTTIILVTTIKLSEILDISDMPEIINRVNPNYLLVAFLSVIGAMLLESLIMKNIIQKIHGVKDFKLAFKATILNLFYNLLTPQSSGGQISQVLLLKQNKIKGQTISAIIVNKFMLYHLCKSTYCTLFIILNLKLLLTYPTTVYTIVLIAALIYIGAFFTLLLIICSKKTILKIVNIATVVLVKIKLIKNVEEKQVKMINFINEYNEYSILMWKNPKFLIKNVLLTFVQISITFGSVYFIFKSFGYNNLSAITGLTLQTFLYMFVCLSPTPGNAGANEYGFYVFYKHLVDPNIIGYIVVLYSIVIYYFNLVFCGALTLIFHIRSKKTKQSVKAKS